jgi:predicted transposase YbfD/YdcC
MLATKGRIVTIDAMGCQRAIAQQIVDQMGDYVLALKGNQGTLHDDVHLFLEDPESSVQTAPATVEGDHGRIETRKAFPSTDISWLQEQHDWPGLAAVGKIARTREIKGVTSDETVYYLLSTPMTVVRFAEALGRRKWPALGPGRDQEAQQGSLEQRLPPQTHRSNLICNGPLRTMASGRQGGGDWRTGGAGSLSP